MSIYEGLPRSPFVDLTVKVLTMGDVETLQRFYRQNPDYAFAVTGEPPTDKDAEEDINASLPDGWAYSQKWFIAYVNGSGEIEAVVDVVADLLASSVWHIGFFMIARHRYGSGDAQTLLASLASWITGHGGRWLRLGVVVGNHRAERFWEKQGFQQVCLRHKVPFGWRTNTVRVMVKPLAGEAMNKYLRLVERDQKDSG